MKLYLVEEVGVYSDNYFYWAENEGDALDQHEAQGADPDLEWVASPVWANNKDARYRGYVVDNN